ncbi:YciI family protein [Nonomuraea ferruginea]|uniref:YciI family protein n=1 Tax=Nonomuraea ferruginea TaxID=46174 RepID=UPI003616A3DC
MKFMIIGKGSAETEAGVMPSRQLVDDMMAYNESLAKAGVLLAAEGLAPAPAPPASPTAPASPRSSTGPSRRPRRSSLASG